MTTDVQIKVYKNRDIVDSSEGTAYQNPDGSVRLSEIVTKPNGSNSNYLSIGKFIVKDDEFGDSIAEWHHYGYPNQFKMDGFKFKTQYTSKGAATSIEWTFLVSSQFISEGWAIAKIGSGVGGREHRSTDVEVLLDSDRELIIG